MASIAYDFECDKQSAFLMDPNARQRFGYVTVLGLAQKSKFKNDLTVSVPWTGTTKPSYPGITLVPGKSGGTSTAAVMGVIENFSWSGGVGDAISIDFWVSQQNAIQLKSMQQVARTSTSVDALGWWIADYDQQAMQWYQATYPKLQAVIGTLQGQANPSLNVDLTGAPVNDGISVMVYKISIAVVPASNQSYALTFANSATTSVVKSWGLVLGTLSASL